MVLLTVGILLAISLPIVFTLMRTTSRVDVTYSNVDEQLWLSTNLQRLVRSAVAPTPSFKGSAPVPAFEPGSITPTSMTFTTNTGTANGPEQVTAECTPTPAHQKLCDTPTSTFTVTITSPVKTSCPHTSTTTVHHCTYTPAKTKPHHLVQATHVKNGANGQPLFVFAFGPVPASGQPMTTTTVCSAPGTPAPCVSGDSATFDGPTSCKAAAAYTPLAPFATCPPGEIETVNYDLQVNANTSRLNGGNQAEDDTGVFVLSSSSMLFDPSVG